MVDRGRPFLSIVALVVALAVWMAGLPGDVVRAAPAAAGPELTVGPATGLGDGQPVTVTGTGFAPDQVLTIHQCEVPDFVGLVDCDLGTARQVTADGDGSVSVQMPVYAVIDTWNTSYSPFAGVGEPVDCRQPGRCMLATDVSFQEVGAAVTAPLSFEPGATEHLPAITASVSEGLVDRQEIRIEGQGFVRSVRPVVRIRQCGTLIDPDLGERLTCRLGPVATVELDQDGAFTADVVVSTTIGPPSYAVDCRTAVAACHIEAVAAGVNETVRTVARAELAFDPDAPLPDWPPPQVTVTPAAGLGDVDNVAVHGTGFKPGGDVSIWLCPVGMEVWSCVMPIARPAVDAQGVVDTEVAVQPNIEVGFDGEEDPGGGSIDCRRAPGCELIARDDDQEIELRTPLSFADPEPGTRYLDPVFDDVDVVRDVVYRETVDASGNPVQLKLDLYLPRGDTATSRPATVWMHGGWFRGGSRDDEETHATMSARYGQVGVSIDYRTRRGASQWQDMYLASLDAYDDATAAVEWLQEHADDYGIDPEAIMAGGFSAGAVTAFNLANLPGQRGPATSRIAAAIPRSGLPYTPPEPGEPPTIAFHGTDDFFPHDNLEMHCQQAAALAVPCELVTYDGGGHGVGTTEEHLWRSSAFVAEHVLEPRGYFDVTADAGGPYEVEEGSTVGLDATGSTSSTGTTSDGLRYAWSPADRLDDPASATPTVAGLDDGTETLGLDVTSSHGVTDQAEAQVTTTNVAPAIEALGLPGGVTGHDVAFEASVTDPGRLDTHIATVDWGDGTVETATVEQAAAGPVVRGRHTYTTPGEHEVTLTVTDDDGGSDERAGTVVVGCTVLGNEGDDHRLTGGRGFDLADGGPGRDECTVERRRLAGETRAMMRRTRS